MMNANDERAMQIADSDDGQHGAELHGQQAAEQHAGSRQTWPLGQNPPALVAGTPQASAIGHSPVADNCTLYSSRAGRWPAVERLLSPS